MIFLMCSWIQANPDLFSAASSIMYMVKKPPQNSKAVSIEVFHCASVDTSDKELAESSYLAPEVYNPVSIDLNK